MPPRQAVVLLVLGVLALPALAQFQGSEPKIPPRKEDIKYIKCQVCELLAKNAYKQVKGMFKQATPSNRVSRGCQVRLGSKVFLECCCSRTTRGCVSLKRQAESRRLIA
jgi:hypothetical protein